MKMTEDIERLRKKVIAHLCGDDRFEEEVWQLWLNTPDKLCVDNLTNQQQIEKFGVEGVEAWIDNITGPSPGYG
jgi:hypothetical protein